MAKYLITGGAGFIGSNLARHILDKEEEVVVLDNFATGKRENLEGIADQITLVEGDIRDRAMVDQAMAGCAAVFHQAALGSVPRSMEDPLTSHQVNVDGTVNVLESARSAGARRVVFAASSAAYGDQKESPKHEGMVPLPISPYAAGKVSCEAYLRAYATGFGMETVSLRYFNVFGPRQDPAGAYAAVIPAFVSRLLHGERPVVYGDGEQSRDFCYVENVCRANWLAAHAPAEACSGKVVNIACGERISLNQILDLLRELLGSDLQADYQAPRAGDVRHSLANVAMAGKAIGYQPEIFFEDGLRRAIDWYRENLG